MDDYAMNQDRDYRERLLHEVRNAPYFLCLLTEDAVEELCTLNDSSDNEENIYFQEIKTAFESEIFGHTAGFLPGQLRKQKDFLRKQMVVLYF